MSSGATIQSILQGLIDMAPGAVMALAAVIGLVGFGLACCAAMKIYQTAADGEGFPWGWGGAFLCATAMTIVAVVNAVFSLIYVG